MKWNADVVAIGIAIVVALILIFLAVRRLYESKRSEALRSVAVSLGMSFEDGRDIDATKRFGPFQLFSIGDGKKVRNYLSGTIDGVDVTTFGSEYTTGGSPLALCARQWFSFVQMNCLSLGSNCDREFPSQIHQS